METKPKEVVVDGITYVQKGLWETAKSLDGLTFVIVRTYSAGVHAGYLKERNGKEVTLINSIRIWKWAGAATLSQLAMEGTKDPKNCKFPQAVSSITLTEAIEIIPCTEAARQSIEGVEKWKE
jgi:hypothetical protein